jgi:hypothetical protein
MQENVKYKFGNGYCIMKLVDYPEKGQTSYGLYTSYGKVVGLIQIVGDDLKIENRYNSGKGNWKERVKPVE